MKFLDWLLGREHAPIAPHVHAWTVVMGPRRGDGLTIYSCPCGKRESKELGAGMGEAAYQRYKRNPEAGWPKP